MTDLYDYEAYLRDSKAVLKRWIYGQARTPLEAAEQALESTVASTLANVTNVWISMVVGPASGDKREREHLFQVRNGKVVEGHPPGSVLSRRDEFAKAALTGLLAHSNIERAAKNAVVAADALIRALDGAGGA